MHASDEVRASSAQYSVRVGGGAVKERQHTRTLVVVVVVFVVCELPDLTLRAWMALHRHAPQYVAFPRRRLLYVNVASNLLLTVNSCVNFVIYCFMGRRFRLILLRMIGYGRPRMPRWDVGSPAPAARLRHAPTLDTTRYRRRPRWRTRTV